MSAFYNFEKDDTTQWRILRDNARMTVRFGTAGDAACVPTLRSATNHIAQPLVLWWACPRAGEFVFCSNLPTATN